MTPALASAGLLGLAVLLGAPVRHDRSVSRARRARWPASVLAAVGLAGLCLGAGWVGAHGVVLGVIGALVAVGVLRVLRRRQEAAHARQRAAQVLAACDALASDLVAGQPPSVALDRAAAEWGELLPVATAGQMGADVPAALRELAARPGAAQLRRVAATWQVAHLTGVGLASAMDAASAAIRADMRTARLVATELAAAQATARMLAVLPIGVLLLGIGVGGDPLGFLFGTTPGVVVLASGLGLSFAGMAWLDRIADRVLHP